MPNAARCGGDFRFALCVAGTCGSPTHAPLPFCDTIQFVIETDRSCHRQRPGAEWRSGLFSLPQICSAPSEIQTDRPSHRLSQDSPSRTRAAERHTKALHSSLVQPRPSPPTSRERQRTALRRGGESVPRQQCGTAKRPFPRTAPHAGHRLVLNPCRRAAHRNSSFFSIHSPSPAPFSLRDGQQNKNIFCFLVT